MCQLGGQFAGIVQVSLPANALDTFKSSLTSLQEEGLQILIAEDTADADSSGRTATFELIGQDQPGIIQKISAVLAEHHVNVVKLDSSCESAPWSGEPLFKAQAQVQIPESSEVDSLRSSLEAIAQDLMVDIQFD